MLLGCFLLFPLRFSNDKFLKPFINSYNSKKGHKLRFHAQGPEEGDDI